MHEKTLGSEIERLCGLQKNELCKEPTVKDVKGRYEMPKVVVLTQAILMTVDEMYTLIKKGCEEKTEKPKFDGKLEADTSFDDVKTVENDTKPKQKDRSEYLQNVKPGQIVAYKISETTAKSGKVVNISFARKRLKVVSLKGKESNIDFADVLWVKTAQRWPKGVFQMLINNNVKAG